MGVARWASDGKRGESGVINVSEGERRRTTVLGASETKDRDARGRAKVAKVTLAREDVSQIHLALLKTIVNGRFDRGTRAVKGNQQHNTKV
jgi:hypothetical protein